MNADDVNDGKAEPPRPPFGFYDHALQHVHQRGMSPADVSAAQDRPIAAMVQADGNHFFAGRNGLGVVVDGATGEIVMVIRS